MSKIPSEWATLDVQYGEGQKYLYSPDRESLEFHSTNAEAQEHMRKSIEGGAKMVAVLQVVRLFKAKAIEIEDA